MSDGEFKAWCAMLERAGKGRKKEIERALQGGPNAFNMLLGLIALAVVFVLMRIL